MEANFLLSLFILTLTFTIASSSLPPSPSPTSPNSTDFLVSRCHQTLYFELCVASLSRYASSLHQNPVRLAHISTKLASSHLHSATSHISTYLRTNSTATDLEVAALKDCVDALKSAEEQTRMSGAEIRRLGMEEGMGTAAWRVSNAQTWMSAALTNEETCTDGFVGVERGTVEEDVCARVGRVEEFTSIALAFVNRLVNGP